MIIPGASGRLPSGASRLPGNGGPFTRPPFDPDVHERITRAALKGSGLSLECIDLIVKANIDVDFGAVLGVLWPFGSFPFDDSLRHGDNNRILETLEAQESRWREISDWNTHGKGSVCRQSCKWMRQKLKLLGEYLHTVQDLYSHANYVERNGGANPDPMHPRLPWAKAADLEKNRMPVWDMDTSNIFNYAFYQSGYFTRWEVFYHFSEANTDQHFMTNKDGPDEYRAQMRNENQITNFDLAVDVATRHSGKVWDKFVASLSPCAQTLLEKCCSWRLKAGSQKKT